MKLKAVLEVSIIIKENEGIEEANARAIEKLIDVVDEWINALYQSRIRYRL